MKPRQASKIAGFVTVLGLCLATICFFGIYVIIGDGIFAGLMLQGVFFPPIENFHIVTNGSNRFLLQPLARWYQQWPQFNWFDLTQIVPGIITYVLLLYIVYKAALRSIAGKWALPVATSLCGLLGIVFAETTILYDPLSSSLILPVLVFLLPTYCTQKWVKAGAYVMLVLLLLICWQLRFQGIFVGLVPAVALIGLMTDTSPLLWLRRYWVSFGLIVATFLMLWVAGKGQDQSLTPEEEQIALLDSYMYTFADAKMAKPDSYNMADPADSIQLIAYYTFYFAEPTDTALAYMQRISYPSVTDGDPWIMAPIKWSLLWENAIVSGPLSYHGYGRLMTYLAVASVAFLFWVFLLVPTTVWRWKALLWVVFSWGYFWALGISVKMVYKLAVPLSFFFIASLVLLALHIWRTMPAPRPANRQLVTTLLALGVLLGITLLQIDTYAQIKQQRQGELQLKQSIVDEMNTLFTEKLLVFDFFSMLVLEKEIGADNTSRILKPEATMFGDFYMSLFPGNKKHLEKLTGTSNFVSFFQYCATNPQKVVLVMSQYRIDLINTYLKEVKGIELIFEPLEGDFKIEDLEYSYYEVPLKLNYYTVQFPH